MNKKEKVISLLEEALAELKAEDTEAAAVNSEGDSDASDGDKKPLPGTGSNGHV